MDLGLYGHKAKNFKLKEGETFMNTIYIPKGRAAEYCELAFDRRAIEYGLMRYDGIKKEMVYKDTNMYWLMKYLKCGSMKGGK